MNDPMKNELTPAPKLRLERKVSGEWYEWGTYGHTKADLQALFEGIAEFAADGFHIPETLRVVEVPA